MKTCSWDSVGPRSSAAIGPSTVITGTARPPVDRLGQPAGRPADGSGDLYHDLQAVPARGGLERLDRLGQRVSVGDKREHVDATRPDELDRPRIRLVHPPGHQEA